MRTVVVAAGLAMMASIGAGQAYAADKAPAVDPMAEAPAIVASAKVACEPTEAKILGGTEYTKPDNSKVKGQIFEIACKAGPGFMLTVVSPTEVYQPFTCTLADKIHKTKTDSVMCSLEGNKPHYKWLNPVVQPYLPGCVVSDARVIGSTSTAPLIDRYEVACGTQMGGIIDYAQLGQTAPTDFRSCLATEGTSSACQFTTKEEILTVMKPVAAKADPKCQVSDVRLLGPTSKNDGYFYEFGCSNQPGFIVLTKLDNSLDHEISCAAAASLGGCKFTDAGVAAADAKTTYTQTLKKGGFNCTVKDYNVIGTQESTKRDYVEFTCAENPWGLIGFVPQEGSTAGTRLTDCFIAQSARNKCSLVTVDVLNAQLDKLIKVAEPGKNCDLADARYIGESDSLANGAIVEIACKNKRGYIGTVTPDRTKFADTPSPCTIAKAHKEPIQCEIAGNGTYAAGND